MNRQIFFQRRGSVGARRSMSFPERGAADGLFVLRYRLMLGESVLRFSFKIANDGRIAQIYWW
jgi:hypothetical protein